MTIAAGARLGPYEIRSLLGAGGMGEVYRATDPRLARDVALKVLPPEVASDPARIERFRREARAVAALNHPGIVTIHSVEESGGRPLPHDGARRGRGPRPAHPRGGLPGGRLLELAAALASALRRRAREGDRPSGPEARQRHGDATDGRVKVLDFGLAKVVTPGEGASADSVLPTEVRTREGVVVGTVPYMSPEQVQGRELDYRTDLFSLGVILHELATGQRPFRGDSPAELVARILRDTPAALTDLRPDLPPGLARLVRLCLEKEPQRRCRSALELRDELEGLRTEVRDSAGRVRPDDAALRTPSGRRISAIAVLPLSNLSREPEEEYFADGMTDALITDLAKATRLRVISRVGHAIPGDDEDPGRDRGRASRRRFGRRLGVPGGRPRADQRPPHQRWHRRAPVGRALRSEARGRPLPPGRAGARDRPGGERRPAGTTGAARPAPRKVDPDVYLLDLRGRHAREKRTETGFREALELFQRGIDLDPTYAPAYVGLAESLSMLANYGLVAPAEILPRTLAARTGRSTSTSRSADAHRVLAFVRWQFEFSWQVAVAEYERALELDPNSALTNYWFGAYLSVVGSFERGRSSGRAEELDPLSPGARGARLELLLRKAVWGGDSLVPEGSRGRPRPLR